jgi:hypothetical protein
MTLTAVRRCLGAVALIAVLALIAACSESISSSSSPTGPTAALTGSLANETDPCLATIATVTTVDDPAPPPTSTCSGRFTGGGFQINTNGLRVSRGFTLHCDARLSNNFEVNWAGGNNFHIDKNPTDVTCSLIANPNPPDAPVNRIEINGTGTLNGAPATVTLVLVDNGEKAGAPPDQAYIVVNGTVLTNGSFDDPAPIDGGNIQAHFDQPHRNR